MIGLLASAAVGAIWASCAQEYSADGARDRFAQLEPRILLAADGYHYGGKTHDRRAEATALAAALPSVRTVVWIDNLGLLDDTVAGARFDAVVALGREPEFTPVPFSHPLWVLFSSGTTGTPKGTAELGRDVFVVAKGSPGAKSSVARSSGVIVSPLRKRRRVVTPNPLR